MAGPSLGSDDEPPQAATPITDVIAMAAMTAFLYILRPLVISNRAAGISYISHPITVFAEQV